MKALVTISFLFLPLAVLAADTAASSAKPAEANASSVPADTTTMPDVIAPATPPQPVAAPAIADSPLVAAAKRASHAGKKPANVITNETLLHSGGHLTTTKSTYVPSPLPADKPTQSEIAATEAAREKQAAIEKKEKAAKDARERRHEMQRSSTEYHGDGEEMGLDDPARAEHHLDEDSAATSTAETPTQKP